MKYYSKVTSEHPYASLLLLFATIWKRHDQNQRLEQATSTISCVEKRANTINIVVGNKNRLSSHYISRTKKQITCSNTRVKQTKTKILGILKLHIWFLDEPPDLMKIIQSSSASESESSV